MEIKKDFKNDLFGRQELVLEVKSEKNPSFDEVRKMIADKVGKPEENVYVNRILGGFGNDVFEVEAQVYDSKESLDSIKRIEMTSKARKEEIKAKADAVKAKAEGGSEGGVGGEVKVEGGEVFEAGGSEGGEVKVEGGSEGSEGSGGGVVEGGSEGEVLVEEKVEEVAEEVKEESEEKPNEEESKE